MSSPIEQKIDDTQQKLVEIHRQLKRSTQITGVIGILAMILLTAYFFFGYTQIAGVLKPQILISAAGEMLDDQLPAARKTIEAELIKLAPALAEQLSQQVIAAAPSLRLALEDYTLDRTEAMVSDLSTMSEKEFRKVLQQNGPIITKAVKELADKEQVSDETLKLLEEALEKEMKGDLQADAQELLHTIMALNEKLKRLQIGKNLSKEEQVERETIKIIRRLQSEQDHSEIIDTILPTVSKEEDK